MILRSAFAMVAVLLTGAQALAQSAPPLAAEAGFVVDVKGRWDIVRAGMPPLTVERRVVVRDGDTLWKGDQDPAGKVMLALYTGEIREVSVTTVLVPRPREGIVERVMRAVHMRFTDTFVKASVRGGDDFPEAVLKAEAAGTDFLAIFAGEPRGDYTLAVFDLGADGVLKRPARATARVQVDDRAARGPALPPGLYQVDVSDGPAGLAGSTWVRVIPESRVRPAAAQLAQLQATGTAAGASADLRQATRAVARLYLLALDDIDSASR